MATAQKERVGAGSDTFSLSKNEIRVLIGIVGFSAIIYIGNPILSYNTTRPGGFDHEEIGLISDEPKEGRDEEEEESLQRHRNITGAPDELPLCTPEGVEELISQEIDLDALDLEEGKRLIKKFTKKQAKKAKKKIKRRLCKPDPNKKYQLFDRKFVIVFTILNTAISATGVTITYLAYIKKNDNTDPDGDKIIPEAEKQPKPPSVKEIALKSCQEMAKLDSRVNGELGQHSIEKNTNKEIKITWRVNGGKDKLICIYDKIQEAVNSLAIFPGDGAIKP